MARKILLADDSVTAQNMGRRILSDAGYEVFTVNNGSAALKKIAEVKPDLIVLDVYMPGYGGLEVCQRIREAPETARIPVLLTVGKLEPFKAEEARRVRADAFIVKPFEASELLTALTKLEDKIVPQPAPYKPGRFAKAMASVEEIASGKQFGDAETGWKNRLSIPPPHAAKSKESEIAADASPKETPEKSSPFSETVQPSVSQPQMSGVPDDITDEEIAAIRAAAVAFGAQVEQLESQSSQPEPLTPAIAPEGQTEATLASTMAAKEAQFAAESEPVADAVGISQDTAAPIEPIPAAAAFGAANIESTTSENNSGADDEVTAALASLAPSNGHGEAFGFGAALADQVPVTMATAVANQAFAGHEFSGPRWIAELVPATAEESALILEEEMVKAYAAFAASTAGQELASPVEAGSIQPPADRAESRWEEAAPSVIEAIATATVEPAAEFAALAVPSEANAPDAVAQKEEAAYAAAASAGTGTLDSTMAPETPAPIFTPADTGTDHGTRHRESELAAAWASWKQVRESVLDRQDSQASQDHQGEPDQSESAPVSQAVASEIEAAVQPQVSSEPATEQMVSEQAASPEAVSPETSSDQSISAEAIAEQAMAEQIASEASAHDADEGISSIVDSVLADLKPKLMEQIAKKMAKEKKDKKNRR